MGRTLSVTICALLLLMSYGSVMQPTILDEPQPSSQVNSFNTTYTDDLKISELQLDYTTAFPGSSVNNFLIVDFSQSVDGTYLVLIRSIESGALWNSQTFRGGDHILLHADANGTFLNSVILSNQYKLGSGAWLSTTTSPTLQTVFDSGTTSLIDPPDMSEDIIIAGSLGAKRDVISGSSSVSYRIEHFFTVTGAPQQIFVMSLNRTNFNMTNSVLTPSSVGGSGSCEFAVSEDSFVNSSSFSIGVAFQGVGHSWGGSCTVQMGGHTYSMTGQNTHEQRTNLVMTYDFNLSLLNHLEADGNHIDNPLPHFSQNGGMARLEMTSYSGTGPRELKVRSPHASTWTNADVSNCSTNYHGSGLYDIPMHGSISDHMLLSCMSTTTGPNGTEIYLGKISTSDGTSLGGHMVGSCSDTGTCHTVHMVHPTPTIALLFIWVNNAGSFISPYGTTYYTPVTISVNLSTGAVIQADPLFQQRFTQSYGDNNDVFLFSHTHSSHGGRPNAIGHSSFMFMQYDDASIDELTIVEIDSDLDSYADRVDAFPYEPSQHLDSDGDGFGDNSLGNEGDDCAYQAGNSTTDLLGCPDNDGDGYSNQGDSFINDATQVFDSDTDGYGDNLTGNLGDACPTTYGESTRDRYGCPDADFDGWSDENDAFPTDSSQWEDTDGDDYGDQLIGFQGDACPTTVGNSTEDRYGCLDADGDGWSDDGDDMESNPTQWKDRDGDGYGDNATGTMADAFPSDGTQWTDIDGDGHGDNPYGSEGDWFPGDPERWADADRDGVADEDDAFVNDATQWNDTDGDGHGDELAGNQGDAFPEDPEEWQDSDSDNVGNNADDFPFDPSQQTDSDGDGFGDNPLGSGADRFPDDPSQWSDIDGDGFGDNQTGTDADVFIADPTQHADRDGDGYGDSLSGRLADLFPDNPTQWIDQDADGLGDNLSGIDADPYLFDFDNDGYNDSIDILPKLSSPGDHDNDGCMDEDDAFPLDYRECTDFDGDGEGDNADTDDDNDDWTDTDEIRYDTDPKDPDDFPVEGFEIVLPFPGGAIGLGAWDLIGIFGGVPIFAWILFGFVTRNSRCRKYENQLREAGTPQELEEIALRSEYSLMIRLLGPHQGIRLERLRSELDDAMAGETHHVPEVLEPEDITEDQTHIVEDEMVIEAVSTGPSKNITGRVAEDGYEWTLYQGTNYYRTPNSDADWQVWQD